MLTHYQTTNFRLFQIERDCRRQFQIWRKWRKVIQTGRKHCGKRRNCSLQAISPCPTVFSKGLFPRGVKRCHCVGMGQNLSNLILSNLKSRQMTNVSFLRIGLTFRGKEKVLIVSSLPTNVFKSLFLTRVIPWGPGFFLLCRIGPLPFSMACRKRRLKSETNSCFPRNS